MPHDIEAGFHKMVLQMIEPREGRIEFLAKVLRKAGTVPGDEAVFAAVPLAEDVDGIVELRRANLWQKTRFERFCDKLLADCRDCSLLLPVQSFDPNTTFGVISMETSWLPNPT